MTSTKVHSGCLRDMNAVSVEFGKGAPQAAGGSPSPRSQPGSRALCLFLLHLPAGTCVVPGPKRTKFGIHTSCFSPAHWLRGVRVSLAPRRREAEVGASLAAALSSGTLF